MTQWSANGRRRGKKTPAVHSSIFDSYVVVNLNDYRTQPPGHPSEYLSLSHDATELTSMQAALAVPRSADGRLCYDYLSAPSLSLVRFNNLSSAVINNTALSTVTLISDGGSTHEPVSVKGRTLPFICFSIYT